MRKKGTPNEAIKQPVVYLNCQQDKFIIIVIVSIVGKNSSRQNFVEILHKEFFGTRIRCC